MRFDPDTGERITSVIKSIGQEVVGPNVNMQKQEFYETVSVMGGEDWLMWMKALKVAELLAERIQTFNYSYLGSDLNKAYYREETLGQAKADCEVKSAQINELLADIHGKSTIVVAT